MEIITPILEVNLIIGRDNQGNFQIMAEEVEEEEEEEEVAMVIKSK